MREAGLPDIRKVPLINAPIAVVWTAVSTSEGLASWWGPNSFIPSIGRPFAVRTAKFGDVRCTLTELRPPEQRLAVVGFDWEPHWHVTFRLKRFNDITAWWMPSTFQAAVGDEFILHAGDFGDSRCVVTECDPPYRVGFDWGMDWHVTFELTPRGNQTEFTLIHSGWDRNKVTEFGHPHGMVRGIMDSGWEKIVHDTPQAALD